MELLITLKYSWSNHELKLAINKKKIQSLHDEFSVNPRDISIIRGD